MRPTTCPYLRLNRLLTAFALACAAPLTAQSMTWQVEADQAIRYVQEDRVEVLSPEGAEEKGWYARFVREENPPVLLGGELDATRRFVDAPIYGIRLIARRLAFDLRDVDGGGRRELILPQNNESAGHRIDVRTYREGQDGTQRITAQIKHDPKLDEERWSIESQARLRGTLELTRTLDRANGRVLGFHSELVVEWQDDRDDMPIHRARIRRLESWTFRDVVEANTPEFRKSIASAIDDAVAAMLGELRDPGDPMWSYGDAGEREYAWSRESELADYVRALVELGADTQEPAMATAMRRLRRARPEGIQSRSLAIRAVAELYTRPGERVEIAHGLLAAPMPREVADEDRAWLAERTAELVEILMARDPDKLLVQPEHEVVSVVEGEQPVRALEAARLCGVAVPVELWRRLGRFFLAQGVAEERAVTLEFGFVDGQRRKVEVVPIGWVDAQGYTVGGTATAIATASCLRIAAALLAASPREAGLAEELGLAADGGLAWLGRAWTPLAHPGAPFHWASYRAQWFETAAQAFERAGVRTIDGRDWYFEAAVIAEGLQYPRAKTWAGEHDTCRMLGFLRPQLAGPSTSR